MTLVGAIAIVLLIVVICHLLTRLCALLWRGCSVVSDGRTKNGHHWVALDTVDPTRFCNVCDSGVFSGFQCDHCGVIVDGLCVRQAEATLACKVLSSNCPVDHLWVRGNLPMNSHCMMCDQDCGIVSGLQDYRCCWCQRTVHRRCMASVSPLCDFGEFSDVILPPNCVKLKYGPWKYRRTVEISEVSKPATVGDWTPLFVFANKLSGNSDGELVLQRFRKVLNPVQVFEFSEVVINDYICSLRSVPSDAQAIVLAAGGDGTISWILSLIERTFQEQERRPVLAILPLGTGNDLSRVLGWGSASTAGDVDAKAVIAAVRRSKIVHLDRWNVQITLRSRLGMTWMQQNFKMNNYLSVGVDALVTLNFHHRRKTLPRVMSGRFINKLLFFTYGTKDVLERACRNLQEFVEVRLDDRPVSLPPVEGIVVLNIPCWGAGVRPWDMGVGGDVPGPSLPQAIDDGLLEVFALYSSFHIAQLQIGLSEPLRLGQAKRVEMIIRNNSLPMQVDGEPWSQCPASIAITPADQASVLSCVDVDNVDEQFEF